MRKIAFFLIPILGSVLVLSSCGTIKKLNVDKTPPEQSAIVRFVNTGNYPGDIRYRLSQWNGHDISADLYPIEDGYRDYGKIAELTVPAGNNSFVFEAEHTIQNGSRFTYYRIKDAALQYNMEAGKKYEIKGRTKFLSFTECEFYIAIYDVTKKRELLEEWVLGNSKDFQ